MQPRDPPVLDPLRGTRHFTSLTSTGDLIRHAAAAQQNGPSVLKVITTSPCPPAVAVLPRPMELSPEYEAAATDSG